MDGSRCERELKGFILQALKFARMRAVKDTIKYEHNRDPTNCDNCEMDGCYIYLLKSRVTGRKPDGTNIVEQTRHALGLSDVSTVDNAMKQLKPCWPHITMQLERALDVGIPIVDDHLNSIVPRWNYYNPDWDPCWDLDWQFHGFRGPHEPQPRQRRR